MEFLFMLALGLAVYFAPFSIASMREHPNAAGVFVLNLLLGWTFVGWVIALVWAVTAVRPAAPPPEQAPRSAPPGGVTVTLTEEQARRLGIGTDAAERKE